MKYQAQRGKEEIMRNRMYNTLAITVLVLSIVLSQAQAQELSPQEQMIHRRAVEAAVWGMPLEGTRGLLVGTRTDLGGDWNDVVYFSKPMVSRHGFLTANNQTPYVVGSFNTKDGPLVVEVPGASDKAKYFGSFVDAVKVTAGNYVRAETDCEIAD
jgi:hypothetical protein